ncbi:MAG: hypothetical protein K9K65_17965 [Desulfarculaceae bacterium]|nr:hypothetical protein [Desulfarculaceae bacterium]MCF8124357.1 hypothetical protein [Desulfarculaceae bacterium]
MKNLPIMRALGLVLAALMLLAAACGTSYDQETYGQIKVNMTLKEVIHILGEPTESKGVSLGGVSGTSAIWKDEHGTINVQFINGKVKLKSFTKPG